MGHGARLHSLGCFAGDALMVPVVDGSSARPSGPDNHRPDRAAGRLGVDLPLQPGMPCAVGRRPHQDVVHFALFSPPSPASSQPRCSLFATSTTTSPGISDRRDCASADIGRGRPPVPRRIHPLRPCVGARKLSRSGVMTWWPITPGWRYDELQGAWQGSGHAASFQRSWCSEWSWCSPWQ